MRNTARNKTGSDRMSHEIDRLYRVWMSKIPRGVGLNLEFMDMLLIYL